MSALFVLRPLALRRTGGSTELRQLEALASQFARFGIRPDEASAYLFRADLSGRRVFLNDIVKRRFVLGPARGLSHGLADLTACDRVNLEEAGLFSVDYRLMPQGIGWASIMRVIK